jgi:acetoacetyl-CoA synthetase
VGRPLIDEVGELVCTEPMPSMPLLPVGRRRRPRYHDSYFDMYPGVWRHGDWAASTGSASPQAAPRAVIYGRSDATINRHGIRMGTAELYRAVEASPRCWTAWWSTWNTWAARAGCRCSWCCATGLCSTPR